MMDFDDSNGPRLRAPTALVEEILASFTRQGLVTAEADATYRYAPQSIFTICFAP